MNVLLVTDNCITHCTGENISILSATNSIIAHCTGENISILSATGSSIMHFTGRSMSIGPCTNTTISDCIFVSNDLKEINPEKVKIYHDEAINLGHSGPMSRLGKTYNND